jgi:hypothetical protein
MPALALLSALGWERAMAHRARAGLVFFSLCLFNIALALTIVLKVGEVTRTGRSQDVAQILACAASESDTVYASDAYPYDLPFYAQTSRPMVVLGNWDQLRKTTGDGWHRELFEGSDFDAQAAKVLQDPTVLAQAGTVPGNWFITKVENPVFEGPGGWKLFYRGAGWSLYQSGAPLAPEGPKPAEHKGLPGCKNQGQK